MEDGPNEDDHFERDDKQIVGSFQESNHTMVDRREAELSRRRLVKHQATHSQ